MNNDLISREALKKALTSDTRNIYVFECLSRVLETIDNAPTVEPEITNDDLQAAMTESYHLGYELAETKFKRPQGEWIFDKENSFTIDMFRCSICGYFGATHFKFCPKCGAKMDKEEEDGK